MLILILIKVYYLYTEYCFQLSRRFKWSESLCVIFPPPKISHPLTGGIFPLKKHWRWEYIHTSKTSEGRNIFLRRYIISKSVMTNITTRKEKLLHSVLPPFLQGEQGEVEFFREAEDFVKVIFKLIKYHIR